VFPYRTLNHLGDGIWSHHGQQTALPEIELSLLEFAVSITRSVHAIEVSVVRDRISAQFRDRFRSLSNVNLSGSQNASKNAAAAAEKTE
jgi:hypothetical protein